MSRSAALPLAAPADAGEVAVICRFCGRATGDVVLDLGEQPSSELFPLAADTGPDPLLPLRMWLCAGCGLAQLVGADNVVEEPLGTEPAALARQRAAAVQRLVADGLLPAWALWPSIPARTAAPGYRSWGSTA